MIKHLPLCNFQKSLRPGENSRWPQACSAWHHLTLGRWGWWRQQHVRMCVINGEHFSPLLMWSSLWYACGWRWAKGKGVSRHWRQKRAMRSSEPKAFLAGPLAAIVFLACIPRGSPPLPWRALILEFLVWTDILFHLKICPDSQVRDKLFGKRFEI